MDVREKVLRQLALQADTRFSYISALVRAATGCQDPDVWEALWGLVADGLVYLDPAGQPGTDNWLWRLSATGNQAALGGSWEPRDPPGYLRRLRREIPDLDPLALRYVEEALRAFNARCYLATSVMLGVASEQVFNGLATAYVEAGGSTAASLSKLTNPRSTYFARFQEFRKRLEPRRQELPDELADVLTLDAVGDLLRVTRNAAGHPSGREIDEDTARTHLQMAALYLRKMTEMRLHFAGQSASGSSPAPPEV